MGTRGPKKTFFGAWIDDRSAELVDRALARGVCGGNKSELLREALHSYLEDRILTPTVRKKIKALTEYTGRSAEEVVSILVDVWRQSDLAREVRQGPTP